MVRPARQCTALTAGFCAHESLERVNLNPDVASDEQTYIIRDDGHWSVAGYRIVADALWRQGDHYFIAAPKHDATIVSHGTGAPAR